MKDSTTFISYHEFDERFGIKWFFFAFQGIISALKSLKQLNRDCPRSRNKHGEDFHEQFLKMEKVKKLVYERLVRIKKIRPTLSKQMVWWLLAWKQPNNWLEVYFNCTKITRVITFLFKPLHRRLSGLIFFLL